MPRGASPDDAQYPCAILLALTPNDRPEAPRRESRKLIKLRAESAPLGNRRSAVVL